MAVASHLLKTQWLSGLLLSKTRDMAWRLAIGASRKGKSKHNTLCFSTFALTWRKLHGTLYPGCRFACPGLRRSLGFQPALG